MGKLTSPSHPLTSSHPTRMMYFPPTWFSPWASSSSGESSAWYLSASPAPKLRGWWSLPSLVPVGRGMSAGDAGVGGTVAVAPELPRTSPSHPSRTTYVWQPLSNESGDDRWGGVGEGWQTDKDRKRGGGGLMGGQLGHLGSKNESPAPQTGRAGLSRNAIVRLTGSTLAPRCEICARGRGDRLKTELTERYPFGRQLGRQRSFLHTQHTPPQTARSAPDTRCTLISWPKTSASAEARVEGGTWRVAEEGLD